MKELGIIAIGGMGGAFNPPNHPEHDFHVQTDLKRPPQNRGCMSLSYALECEYLADQTKKEAKDKLDNWNKLPLENKSVKKWIIEVLAYFSGCYSPDGKSRDVNTCKVLKNGNINKNLGIMFIREYYPEYKPTEAEKKIAQVK